MDLTNINYFATNAPWFFYFLLIIISLCVGSLINVIVMRLPEIIIAKAKAVFDAEKNNFNLEDGVRDQKDTANNKILDASVMPQGLSADTENTHAKQKHSYLYLAWPGSHCPSCNHALRSIDLIPVLSFLLLKGRCRYCHAKVSWRYPAVELSTTIISLFWVWYLGATILALLAIVFSLWLLIMALIDYDVGLLPDGMTISGMWLGLLVSLGYFFVGPAQAMLGTVVGYAFLWLIATVYKLLRRKEGMGYGDCKMLAMLGAWVGVRSVIFIVLLASSFALLSALLLMLRKKINLQQSIRFGPYLAASGFVIFLYQMHSHALLTKIL